MRIQLFGLRIQISSLRDIAGRRRLPETKVHPKPTEEASEDFWAAFCCFGTITATCLCGRTHFATRSDLDYEEGELEHLLERQQECPERYISDCQNDSLSLWDGPNGPVIWGCPCHSAKRFELFLLDYRGSILEFYRRRLERKEASNQLDREALEKVTPA